MANQKYPHQSAGKIMASGVPTAKENDTVNDVRKLLVKKTKSFESINYIYVLDNENRLAGVLSIKEVFRSEKEKTIKDLMHKKIVTARSSTDQEKLALLALKNGLKEIPVIDKNGVFLGAVLNDTIMQIVHSEGVENFLRFGGVVTDTPYDDIFKLPITSSIRHRLPWLIAGLFGGVVAAGIISFFEGILSTYIILAAYIPLVVYMSGAVCAQMQAFIIRDLSSGQTLNLKKYLFRQSAIYFPTAIILSIVLYFLSLFLYGSHTISLVLGIALFVAILSSLITGIILPFIFNKLKLDPANASGPMGTIIQDILSIIVYLLIAVAIL